MRRRREYAPSVRAHPPTTTDCARARDSHCTDDCCGRDHDGNDDDDGRRVRSVQRLILFRGRPTRTRTSPPNTIYDNGNNIIYFTTLYQTRAAAEGAMAETAAETFTATKQKKWIPSAAAPTPRGYYILAAALAVHREKRESSDNARARTPYNASMTRTGNPAAAVAASAQAQAATARRDRRRRVYSRASGYEKQRKKTRSATDII